MAIPRAKLMISLVIIIKAEILKSVFQLEKRWLPKCGL